MWFTDYEIEQQQRLIAEVKKHYDLPEVSIEKDLWVTQVLHALFSLPVSDKLIFKGGTSLSKAWGLIDRFSEDIDLAIDPVFLGKPEGDPTKKQIKKLRKASSLYVADDWSMLKAREKCQEFVHSCIAIGAIPYEGDKKTYNIYDGMCKKLCGQSRGEKGARYTTDPLPCDYKSWSDSSLKKKISFCDLIAKEFEGPGMFNRFEKRKETKTS